jgi:hypothetical protein
VAFSRFGFCSPTGVLRAYLVWLDFFVPGLHEVIQYIPASLGDHSTSFQGVNRAHAQGPSARLPNGSTLLKQQQLGQLGYKVVSVPYWEWMALRRDKG